MKTANDKGVSLSGLSGFNSLPGNKKDIVVESVEKELAIMGKRNDILARIILTLACLATAALAAFIQYLFL